MLCGKNPGELTSLVKPLVKNAGTQECPGTLQTQGIVYVLSIAAAAANGNQVISMTPELWDT